MRLLIGAVQFCLRYLYILNIRQEFRTSLSKKIGDNTCFGDGQKVVKKNCQQLFSRFLLVEAEAEAIGVEAEAVEK